MSDPFAHFNRAFRKMDEVFAEFDEGFAAVPSAPLPAGWACPKCGSVWAPTTPGCFTCNGKEPTP